MPAVTRNCFGKGFVYYVGMNLGEQERRMPLWLCNSKDLLSGKMVAEDTVLKKYDVYLIEKRMG